MNLIRLKLLTNFRGLKKDFFVNFSSSNNKSKLLEPYCLVGLNGSGKSNLLELLSEIFYYLEIFSKADSSKTKELSTSFGFEIEYSLPKLEYQTQMQNRDVEYDIWTEKDPIITITKKPKDIPNIKLKLDERELSTETLDSFQKKQDWIVFPKHIIGYSSGMNELISNSFIKMGFHYLDDFNKLSNTKKSIGSLDINRMFFMDYESNKLITICNLLFDRQELKNRDKIIESLKKYKWITENSNDISILLDYKYYFETFFANSKLKPLKEELNIERLNSFSINIRLQDMYNKPIQLPSELNLAIESLKDCSTTMKEEIKSNKNGDSKYIKLDFWVNEATKKAFRKHFGSAIQLYRKLYFLQLLNLHLIGKDTHFKIKNADTGTNLSALIPKYEDKRLVFNISNIALNKKSIKKQIYYKQLSDGEHQFLHVLGTIILLDVPGTLFILDEPETHFNPEWRSKFVSMLNACLKGESKNREQELFLTTHSPFIVSDCKSDKVFIFNRDTKNNVQYEKPQDYQFNTYGASIDSINLHVFKKKESIAEMALKKLKELKSQIEFDEIDKHTALEKLMEFGDSFEKMLVIKELYSKEENE